MSRPTMCRAVTVKEYSDNVFEAANLVEYPLAPLAVNEVLLKMVASPINPSDLMTISGRYGSAGGNVELPKCPINIGYEGVAEIAETGSDVTSVAVGDWVIPAMTGKLGLWRDYGICKETQVFKVDKRVGFKTLASMFINPSTAYFLLTEAGLEPGQWVIQNGANSMVGKSLIQLAKAMGFKTINVVRNRASIKDLAQELRDLGADQVVTDDDLETVTFEEKPVLAIDCVAGQAGAMLIRHLAVGGTLVNYGALSGQPIPVNPTDIIFKNIVVKGYHLKNSMQRGPQKLMEEVFPFINNLAAEGKFKSPNYDLFSLENFKQGIEKATAGFSNKKQLIVMDKSLL